MFKQQPSDNQLIFITFILVVLMGIPTFQTLTEKDPVIEMAVREEASDSGRSPASIPEGGFAPRISKAAESNFKKFDLSCGEKNLFSAEVSGGFVQFQGKNCLKNFKDGDVEILNRTNGFTASVFWRGDDNYQTDLIQLQQGENEIMIRYRTTTGKVSEQIVHVRSQSI